MKEDKIFYYGGYHFVPVRRFKKEEEEDFFTLSKRLETDLELGLSAYEEEQKYPYKYEDFYSAASNINCDIFMCVENGRL